MNELTEEEGLILALLTVSACKAWIKKNFTDSQQVCELDLGFNAVSMPFEIKGHKYVSS